MEFDRFDRPVALAMIALTGVMFALPVNAQENVEVKKTSRQSDAAQSNPSETSTVLAPIVIDGAGATQGYQPKSTSTATRTDTPLIDIPQAVNVVSEQVLKDQNASNLDEALGNVSGVTQTNTLGGTQDSVIRRGFGDNRDGSILTNGLKTALPRSFNAVTERVEVLKGPSSTLYGILDPGGMVNVVTKKPVDTFGGEIYGSLSSFGGGTTGLDLTGPIEGTDFSYRLIGEYKDVDYWRNFGETKNWLISPSLKWTGEDTEITATYMHEDYSVPFDRGTIFDDTTGRPVDVDRKIRFDEPYNITDGNSDLFQVEFDHELSENWKLGIDYSYSRNVYSDNQARVTAYNATNGNVTRRADATDYSTIYNHAVRADLTGDVEIGGMQHDLLIGASYDYSDTLRTNMIRCNASTNFNIYDPVYGNMPECTTVSTNDSDQTEKLSTASLYVQDSIHLNDQWIVVGGLRYQYYDLLAGKGRPFKNNTDSFGDALVPNAGIVYKLTPDVSLYANAAKTFRPQSSIASLYGNLEPEEGVSYEVGSKFELPSGLTANVALYTSDKENVAYTDAGNVVKTAGLVRAKGLEVDVAGSLTDDVDFIATYAFTDAEVLEGENAGKRPVNVARHTGSLYLAYDVGEVGPSGNSLKIGGGIRAVGDRAGINNNSYDLPGYAVVDAFATYTFDLERPITLQLNLKNIFDRTYYTSSIGSTALGNEIGEPFNATLTARVKF
ncbi:TonB-dependent siderophore receptor [Agrobacterium rosae]|uniref:TonB-dependent siderophore receptor n=2 Tax=Agrobacterium rosae TaxID=1972867 RepID=A0ABU4VUB9_9HYPH|nr:TonB-dependent siderophore receptor [Agrobacterium rosae]MDX8312753.1 TonB-dependent siderophore receptor [Agrobacterium rosae]MDX8329109.1 TonB-dependent siderophore receptor [Agrobacterium rosae]